LGAAKYHLKRADKEIADRSALCELLKRGEYAVIALCRGDEPYIVTLSYGYDSKRHALYFHCAPKGLKTDFIAANPEVCATIIGGPGIASRSCSHSFTSVVLRGKMSAVADPAEKRSAMGLLIKQLEDEPDVQLAKLSRYDDRQWGGLTVLRLDITEITGKKIK